MYIEKRREEHDLKDDDSSYASYCNTKVTTLVEYMESGESDWVCDILK